METPQNFKKKITKGKKQLLEMKYTEKQIKMYQRMSYISFTTEKEKKKKSL